MVQRKDTMTKSFGDLAVDGLLQGLAAGAIMLALLLGVGMLEGVAPATVLARFGLPGSASAVTGLLGHLAVSAVLGLVWGVLYGGLLRRTSLPAWLLGAAMGWCSMPGRRSSWSARPGWRLCAVATACRSPRLRDDAGSIERACEGS